MLSCFYYTNKGTTHIQFADFIKPVAMQTSEQKPQMSPLIIQSVLSLIRSVSLRSGVDPCLLLTHRPVLESLAQQTQQRF